MIFILDRTANVVRSKGRQSAIIFEPMTSSLQFASTSIVYKKLRTNLQDRQGLELYYFEAPL